MGVASQAIIGGLATGSVYALLAIGLVVTYKTSRVINLAHGESLILAGFIVYTGTALADLPLWLAVVLGLAGGAAFNGLVHWALLRPRSSWSVARLILVTLGVTFVVQGALRVIFGTETRSIPPLIRGEALSIAGGSMSPQIALLIGVGLGTCLLVAVLLSRTPFGKRLEASAEDQDAARTLGIDVTRVRFTAFVLAGLLGAVAAVLLVPVTAIDFQGGLQYTLRGFIAAAIGGVQSATTALVAGVGVGLFESLLGAYLGTLYRTPVVFGLLILVALYQSRHIQFGGVARA